MYLHVFYIVTGGMGGMGGMTCPDGSSRLPRDEVDLNNPGDHGHATATGQKPLYRLSE